MSTMEQKFTSLEQRRFQGGLMIKQGLRNCEIVEILKCSLSAVKRWRKTVSTLGIEALAPKPRPGRTPKLNKQQLAKLKYFLKQGATEFGYTDAIWTSRRVRQLIQDQFGIVYSGRQVRRILHKIGYSQNIQIESFEQWLAEQSPHVSKIA